MLAAFFTSARPRAATQSSSDYAQGAKRVGPPASVQSPQVRLAFLLEEGIAVIPERLQARLTYDELEFLGYSETNYIGRLGLAGRRASSILRATWRHVHG